jgi:membrane-associated phospholipid phosphatase
MGRRRPLLSSFLVVAVLCVVSVLFVDQPLARYHRDAAGPEIIAVFHYITDFGDATPYVIVVLVILAGCGIASAFSLYQATFAHICRVTNACVFILLSLAASAAVLHTIKFSMGRYRPRALFESNLYDIAIFTAGYLNSSFPSGHSQVAGALAAALVLVYPRYTLLYVLFAALVGYSRVVTGDHYLSDVMFGLFLGAVSAVLVKQWVYDRRAMLIAIVLPRDHALVCNAGETQPARHQAAVLDLSRHEAAGSQQAHLLETRVSLARNDDVVVQDDSNVLQRLLDKPGHLDVRG